jgi:hypothetical protein
MLHGKEGVDGSSPSEGSLGKKFGYAIASTETAAKNGTVRVPIM